MQKLRTPVNTSTDLSRTSSASNSHILTNFSFAQDLQRPFRLLDQESDDKGNRLLISTSNRDPSPSEKLIRTVSSCPSPLSEPLNASSTHFEPAVDSQDEAAGSITDSVIVTHSIEASVRNEKRLVQWGSSSTLLALTSPLCDIDLYSLPYRQRVKSEEDDESLAAQRELIDPPILGFIQLKRTAATVIENVPGKGSYRIGADIPPVRWLTIELQMRPLELRDYARIHRHCTRSFALGFNDVADSPPTQHGLPPKALLRRHDARSR
ncbi:MAG: hypothetical protein Q9161_005779 [Pseudevernia consocians]